VADAETLRGMRSPRARMAVLSVGLAACFVALYVIAILTTAGQQWDAMSMGAFPQLRSETWLTIFAARDWLPFGLIAIAAIAGVEAMLRGRWEAVAASGTLVSLTALASFGFKNGVLPRPYLGDFAYNYNTFPSGHSAISLAVIVTVVWFGPRWLHPMVVGLLGAVGGFVAIASWLSFAHRGSDIVGGALLAGALACGIAAVAGVPANGQTRPRAMWTFGGVVALAVSALSLIVVLIAIASAVPLIPAEPWLVGLSVVSGTVGTIAVVLANQYPTPGQLSLFAPRSATLP
jgi:hypothetical protein